MVVGLLFSVAIVRAVYDQLHAFTMGAPPAHYDASEVFGWDCPAFEHVFYQGECGACLAFATASAYGMRNCQRGEIDMPSPYRMFDCMNMDGCYTGATLSDVVRVMKHGVPNVMRTPFHFGLGCVHGDLKGSINVFISPTSIKLELMRNGPLTMAIWATEELKYYTHGVFTASSSDLMTDPFAEWHQVVVIGWCDATEEEPIAHWIIQNSWSEDWGERGRAKVAMRNTDIMYALTPYRNET